MRKRTRARRNMNKNNVATARAAAATGESTASGAESRREVTVFSREKHRSTYVLRYFSRRYMRLAWLFPHRRRFAAASASSAANWRKIVYVWAEIRPTTVRV